MLTAPDPSPADTPSPAAIFGALNGFQQTAALKTAIELDVFTHIGAGANTAEALGRACGCSERGVRSLSNALVALGLLEKLEGRYRLTRDAALFLDRRSPAYLGSIAEFVASPWQMENYSHLTAAVRRGGAAVEESAAHEPDSEHWVTFARKMAPMQAFAARALAELLVPKPAGSCKVLDIAAGHGMFGIALAQRHPQAEVYALDWPKVLAVAEENAAAAGVADRFHLLPGSAFETELGSGYDWILLPNFLHHFDAATCVALLRRVRAALAPEGEVAVLEFVVDADRTSPAPAALFSLTMLASTPSGDAYTFEELDAMLREAGFAETELHPLPPSFQRVVIATP